MRTIEKGSGRQAGTGYCFIIVDPVLVHMAEKRGFKVAFFYKAARQLKEGYSIAAVSNQTLTLPGKRQSFYS